MQTTTTLYLPTPDRATLIGAVLRAAAGARRERDRWLAGEAEGCDRRERRELRRAVAEAEGAVLMAAGGAR